MTEPIMGYLDGVSDYRLKNAESLIWTLVVQ